VPPNRCRNCRGTGRSDDRGTAARRSVFALVNGALVSLKRRPGESAGGPFAGLGERVRSMSKPGRTLGLARSSVSASGCEQALHHPDLLLEISKPVGENRRHADRARHSRSPPRSSRRLSAPAAQPRHAGARRRFG
jgi:hypothetical protein